MRIIRALVKNVVLPRVTYEIEPNTENYHARIPFDQGVNTPYRGEPRELCATCGKDTTNEFPFGPCGDCSHIGE